MIDYRNVKWKYDDLDKSEFKFKQYVKGKYKVKECNNIFCFDIETSNGWADPAGVAIGYDYDTAAIKHGEVLTDGGDIVKKGKSIYSELMPVSLMYVWQICIETKSGLDVYMGRTWTEFRIFIDRLTKNLMLNAANFRRDIDDDKLIKSAKSKVKTLEMHIYIHNLGFEFQHLRNVFGDEFTLYRQSVFARSMRKPMRARIRINGVDIIFNDTLCLTHTSLENWTKDLAVKKLKEVVDDDYYNIIRTPETPLTHDEINYSVNDVVSMYYGMCTYRKKYHSLHNIPMTQTGEVRRVCHDEIALRNQEWASKCVSVTNKMSFDFYKVLRKAFLGGWTHANCKYSGRLLHNLTCFDFTSSYPAVMCSRTFPVEDFVECDVSELDSLMEQPIDDMQYHYLVDVTFEGVVSNTWNVFWASSKTDELVNAEKDNGKVYSCDKLTTTMTDLDYLTFIQAYDVEKTTINRLWKAKSGYLPKEFVEVILKYFGKKTELKDKVGYEEDYTIAKQFVNGIYGDCVKKIIDDVIVYIDGWDKKSATVADYNDCIERADETNTYTTYQIGVWVTAWARYNLWRAILEFDDKVVYCDTDSVKGLFDDDDLTWFDEYNKNFDTLTAKVAKKYGLDPNQWKPLKPSGKPSELGYFDRDPDCIDFKTLGAKRYCYTSYDKNGDIKLHTTVAGLSKAVGEGRFDTVESFKNGTYFDERDSKKLITHYNDNQPNIEWTDRDGNKYWSIDQFGLCLEPTSFYLDDTEEYRTFLDLIQGGDLNEYYDTPEILR